MPAALCPLPLPGRAERSESGLPERARGGGRDAQGGGRIVGHKRTSSFYSKKKEKERKAKNFASNVGTLKRREGFLYVFAQRAFCGQKQRFARPAKFSPVWQFCPPSQLSVSLSLSPPLFPLPSSSVCQWRRHFTLRGDPAPAVFRSPEPRIEAAGDRGPLKSGGGPRPHLPDWTGPGPRGSDRDEDCSPKVGAPGLAREGEGDVSKRPTREAPWGPKEPPERGAQRVTFAAPAVPDRRPLVTGTDLLARIRRNPARNPAHPSSPFALPPSLPPFLLLLPSPSPLPLPLQQQRQQKRRGGKKSEERGSSYRLCPLLLLPLHPRDLGGEGSSDRGEELPSSTRVEM